jgi:hypothetical protein
MRKKALLIAAKAGCVGPAVILDGGEWEVESHPSILLEWEGGKVSENGKLGFLRFSGRVRVTSSVREDYKGKPIHLDATQVGR